MLGKRNEEEVSASNTIIGKTTVIKGELSAQGNIRIEGIVEGNINSTFKVVTGQESQVRGNITAQQADIEGHVEGNIVVEDLLTMKATAIVNGDITTGKLILQQGSMFKGKCTMNLKE